ncbi:hypothetical protein AB205_0088430 [Aquarana catesbeiana]|uniref:Uncharacterized protein n=1 Tax=Aquarana catesbeiana TaxID=8400 RepID=A0A2G9RQN2_AQUCT|nr:hypothetical protein AB205_0088430 [Aquarana catesbeiana]
MGKSGMNINLTEGDNEMQVEAEQESQYVDEELGEWAEDMEVRRKEGSGSKDLLIATQRQGPEVEQESEARRKKPK